jgi:hypothetical protein
LPTVASTQEANASETKTVASSSEEALASLKKQAQGKKAGDTVSAAYMENGQVKVYTASVNEFGINPPLMRNATVQKKAMLQGNDVGAFANVAHETGARGIQNNDAIGSKGEGNSYKAAKAANWKKPDGSTWWPDNDGFADTPTKTTLQPGTKIDRYGKVSGKYAAPEGTQFGQRSLAPGSENSPYNSYEVIKPFDVNSGIAAPWFDQPGQGTQYQLPMSIRELIRKGYIR